MGINNNGIFKRIAYGYMQDLKTLLTLRCGSTTGREKHDFILCYCVATHIASVEDTWGELVTFNMFLAQRFEENTLRLLFDSAKKYINATGKLWSFAVVLDKLHITQEEEQKLNFISSNKEDNLKMSKQLSARILRYNEHGLTDKQYAKYLESREIHRLKDSGVTQLEIAKQLGLSTGNVSNTLKEGVPTLPIENANVKEVVEAIAGMLSVGCSRRIVLRELGIDWKELATYWNLAVAYSGINPKEVLPTATQQTTVDITESVYMCPTEIEEISTIYTDMLGAGIFGIEHVQLDTVTSVEKQYAKLLFKDIDNTKPVQAYTDAENERIAKLKKEEAEQLRIQKQKQKNADYKEYQKRQQQLINAGEIDGIQRNRVFRDEAYYKECALIRKQREREEAVKQEQAEELRKARELERLQHVKATLEEEERLAKEKEEAVAKALEQGRLETEAFMRKIGML